MHYCADLKTNKTVFRTTISVNQLSLHGAVAEMCEEYDTFHDRTGQPFVMRIQNLRQVEHCGFLKAIRLFQSVGCARNKLLFLTVQQNLKSSLWTLD